MACIKSASRSALVAFAPDAPYLAAGTLAGAVDLSFSSSANLEIFNMDFQSDAPDLPVVGSCPSNERFSRLSWGRLGGPSEEFRLGLVAGGLGDGSICVWNPEKLLSPDDVDGAVVARLDKHSGPVRGLEFCSLSPNLLASGADEGELCVWDLAKPSEPVSYPPLKNPGSGAQGEISFVSWNPKFQHILASTSYNGMTVVWDLRKQKPLTSISDSSKRRCSVLQWNPDISTQLIVASDDDSSPSFKLWDVRKTISPIKEFVGHTKGVIAMSWCPSDSSLLLTCAKDNRTICWDTVTGEIISELPASTNWNFDIHWYTKIPGIISASSYDGKIGIYNIEACSKSAVGEADFGAAGSFGTPGRLRAPKWLKCPVGISFGFGGKLVSFKPSLSPSGTSSGSEVYVHNVVTEDNLVERSTEFEMSVRSGERSALKDLCEKKFEESESVDDKEAWGFLKIMFEDEGSARSKLLGHLGFTVPSSGQGNVTDELGSKLNSDLSLDENTGNLQVGPDESAFHVDNGDEFFNNAQPSVESNSVDESEAPSKEVQHESREPPENNDESILHALVVGDYKEAVRRCIGANRMADALVIANASEPANGPALWETTRDQYLAKSHLPYLKVVAALVKNDLMALVKVRPLSSWKETLALLCTFAQKEEWTVLCDSLASRLMVGGDTLSATLCYICAGNIDKTVEIWSYKLSSENGGRSYVDLLQDLMEKMVVLALATGQKQFGPSLSKLVENYAELLVSQGLLTTAMGYLKLLGSEDSSQELAILQNRISLSVEEKEVSNTVPSANAFTQPESIYSSEQSSISHATNSLDYYQDKPLLQQQGVSGSQYAEAYQQPAASYGAYQPVNPKKQLHEYVNPAPFQPTPSPQMFVPSQMSQPPQINSAPPVAMPQPAVRSFVPSTPPTLRNVEQYQQPTLGSQLYTGSANSIYQPAQHAQGPPVGVGLSQSTTIPNMMFPQPIAPAPTPGGFPRGPHQSFVQNTGLGPVQPSSPTQVAPAQTVSAPPAPPPTVQTVDTSNVSAEFKPVIATLTRLYNETSEALGGSRANPAKKREIDDNSRKIGALFAKLNKQDISPNAASKLTQLCQALDASDFAAALHIQVILTTSEWDECNFWLAALKRMIKTRQNMRSQ